MQRPASAAKSGPSTGMRTPRASFTRQSFEEAERMRDEASQEAAEARSQCLAMLYQQRALLDLARRSETQLAELQTEKAALTKRAEAAQEQSDASRAELERALEQRGSSQAQLERTQADAAAALERARRADERAETALARATSAEDALRSESSERSRLAAEVAAREGALAGGAAERKLLEDMVRWLETQLREAKAEAAAARSAQEEAARAAHEELATARREVERLSGVEIDLRAAVEEGAAKLSAATAQVRQTAASRACLALVSRSVPHTRPVDGTLLPSCPLPPSLSHTFDNGDRPGTRRRRRRRRRFERCATRRRRS